PDRSGAPPSRRRDAGPCGPARRSPHAPRRREPTAAGRRVHSPLPARLPRRGDRAPHGGRTAWRQDSAPIARTTSARIRRVSEGTAAPEAVAAIPSRAAEAVAAVAVVLRRAAAVPVAALRKAMAEAVRPPAPASRPHPR